MSEKELPVEKTENGDVKRTPEKSKTEKGGESAVPVSKEFDIVIKRGDIEHGFEEAAEKYSTEMKLDGFRKGKIPVDVVKSKYREVIIDEVVNKMIEEYTFKKIREEKIPIISSPVVKNFEFKDGEDLKAVVSVDLFPEVKIPDLSKIQVEIKKDLLLPETYDEKKQIALVLENNKRKQIVKDRPAEDGDFVEFKIQSQFTDTKRKMPKKDSFFEMKDEPHEEIGDLFKDITGKKQGDTFEIEREYPKDFRKKNWAGKKIRHFIEIKSVSEYVTPALNVEFLKSMGFDDEQTFKSKLKEEYAAQMERHRDQVVTNSIQEKLLDTCKFPIPDSIIHEEVRRSQAQYAQILMTLPEDKRADYLKNAKENAERSIRFSFILEEIKKVNEIKVENDDLEKEYKAIAEANGMDVKDVRKYYMNNEQKETLKDSIGRNRALDFLKKKIKIKEV